VVMAIPDDVGMAKMTAPSDARTPMGAAFPRFRTAPDPGEVKRACDLMIKAKMPVLMVGGGAHISGAYEEVRSLAEQLKMPIVTTISGKGIVEETHPLVFGVSGVFGNPIAGEILDQADLVFFVGSKVGQLATFGYQSPRKGIPTIHLDIDPEEIGRNFPDSVPLLGDAKLGLREILKTLARKQPDIEWGLENLKQDHDQWYREMTGKLQVAGTPLKQQAVMDIVNNAVTEDDLVICDASLSSGWAAAFLKLTTAGHRFLAPRGLAGLGWGAPAALGAALAGKKEKRILHFAGDGGFAYSVQELEVMARLELPVVTIVLNNDIFGWIKHVQKQYYHEKYISTDFNHVDFATVARGFGARGYTVNTLEELSAALEREARPEGPAVIDVISDQWETPVLSRPSRKSGKIAVYK